MPAPAPADRPGSIEVITGSMFSGKSEELIRRLRRAQIARQKVQIFKPKIDNRYADDHIISHSEMRIPSQNTISSRELLNALLRVERDLGRRRELLYPLPYMVVFLERKTDAIAVAPHFRAEHFTGFSQPTTVTFEELPLLPKQ